MSQENVEIVRRLYESWATGDLGAGIEAFDPDVEYMRSAGEAAAVTGLAGECRGIDEMVKAAGEWIQTFDVLHVRAERFIEAGESVVIFTRHTGTAKASGVPIDAEFADVMTFRDGRIVRVEQYRTRAKALEAVGLRE